MNLRGAPDALLDTQFELAGLSDDHECIILADQQICGIKRKASSTNDDVGTGEHPNSSDEGAEAHGSDDEARKLRRQLRNRLSAQQARDRKKAQMQQLQDHVLRQQQHMEELQSQLAETEAANLALRNIICAMKGQQPVKNSNVPVQQQQQQDLAIAGNTHLAPVKPSNLLTAVSAPLGTIHRSSSNLIQQPLTPHTAGLRPTNSNVSAVAAATEGVVGGPAISAFPRRPSGSAASAAAAASPTAVSALQFASAQPFRRKSSSTVAALAGLLPIAQRMANDNPTDTTLEALQQLQQHQWQASADQTVLAAAASAASAAEAAAVGAFGTRAGRGSNELEWAPLCSSGSASAGLRDEAQAKRRQLLLLLAQKDSVRKAVDAGAKQRLKPRVSAMSGQQQQVAGAASVPHMGYGRFQVQQQLTAGPPNSAADINIVSMPMGIQVINPPLFNNNQGLSSSTAHSSPDVVVTATSAPAAAISRTFAAALPVTSISSMMPLNQQQLPPELLEIPPMPVAPWGRAPAAHVSFEHHGIGQQQQTVLRQMSGGDLSVSAGGPHSDHQHQHHQQQRDFAAVQATPNCSAPAVANGFAIMRGNSYSELQQQQQCRRLAAPSHDRVHSSSSGLHLSGLLSKSLTPGVDASLSAGVAPSDDFFRLSSAEVMLSDLLSDMA